MTSKCFKNSETGRGDAKQDKYHAKQKLVMVQGNGKVSGSQTPRNFKSQARLGKGLAGY